jgi:hypothetical protein
MQKRLKRTRTVRAVINNSVVQNEGKADVGDVVVVCGKWKSEQKSRYIGGERGGVGVGSSARMDDISVHE